MRSSYLFLLMTLLLSSCSKNDSAIESHNFMAGEFPDRYQLVKMTTSMDGSEKTGWDMAWQEYYLFDANGTFFKSRISNGESSSAEGQFHFLEEEQAFILEYNNSNPLIGTCSSENTEYLYFDENHEYLMSSWWSCDGPGLFYQRFEGWQ